MLMNEELKHIKKIYGEEMMHFCRKNFPTILNEEGKLLDILKNNFNERKDLYDDLKKYELLHSFENYIDYIYNPKELKWIDTGLAPDELLKQKGYRLYEVKKKSELDRFRKYYYGDELLCSFYDNDRLSERRVFFIVKNDALKLKRENYANPDRNDEYSTSVLSIQFKKNENVDKVSIISRYNHSVINPDATYDNNLDNIIKGLSISFKNYYDLDFNRPEEEFSIPGYVQDPKTNKFYKVNVQTDDYCFCPNNIIVTKDGVIDKYSNINTSSYILMDGYLLDLVNKKFISFYEDSFVNDFKNIEDIKVSLDKYKNIKLVEIIYDVDKHAYIVLNNNNQIIEYINNNIKELKRNFMVYNTALKNLLISNVEKIDDNFLYINQDLNRLYLPNVHYITNNALMRNKNLTDIYMPDIKYIGDNFCSFARNIKDINIYKVKVIGNNFLRFNIALDVINLPNLIQMGDSCFEYNNTTKVFNAPKMVKCGDYCLRLCNHIEDIQIDSLKECGLKFLDSSKELKQHIEWEIMLKNMENNQNKNSHVRKRKRPLQK